jgi:hypothetical protein
MVLFPEIRLLEEEHLLEGRPLVQLLGFLGVVLVFGLVWSGQT